VAAKGPDYLSFAARSLRANKLSPTLFAAMGPLEECQPAPGACPLEGQALGLPPAEVRTLAAGVALKLAAVEDEGGVPYIAGRP
jgi:hypothetical protein